MTKTNNQFDQVFATCSDIFAKKMKDYGIAWRILRASSMTDQIYIKARRIRSLEENGVSKIDEGVREEYIGIINYCAMAIIQLEKGTSETEDLSHEETLRLYKEKLECAKQLMMKKNHDYGEAWRQMRICSYTDLILMKIKRTKQIEDNDGDTLISEGIDANYYDMMNYAVFAMIKLDFNNE